MNKEYNHSLSSVIEACGFTEDELDKCYEGAIKLHNKCNCISSVVEEMEKLITSGEYPTFTRFIVMEAIKRIKSKTILASKADFIAEALDKMKLSDSVKVISLNEDDVPKEFIDFLSGNLVKSEHETNDFDENTIKRG